MRVLRSRSKTQPPPAWAIYEALSDPAADQARREWQRPMRGATTSGMISALSRPGQRFPCSQVRSPQRTARPAQADRLHRRQESPAKPTAAAR